MPYPADYGGVIDVFYRIKSLHASGIKIHLHCFEYRRGKQPELNKYCIEVNYYKRSTGIKGASFKLPYIVQSRANKNLLQNLLKDEHPILLEGIHCTYFLFSGDLKNRKIFVRLHNVEFEYYKQLAKNETSIIKRSYYKNESSLLKKYEKTIAAKPNLLAITPKDLKKYQSILGAVHINYLPAFLPTSTVSSKIGKGDYCLYHGNLSVAENEKVATWLCKNIFADLNFTLLIVGKNPSKKLLAIAKQYKNISVISDPSDEKMNELIYNAQINILPSNNSTGIKIKLLNALFKGRHCIVNNAAIDATGLESLCHIAESAKDYVTAIKKLFTEEFTTVEIKKRNELLKTEFNNKKNAEQLMKWIH